MHQPGLVRLYGRPGFTEAFLFLVFVCVHAEKICTKYDLEYSYILLGPCGRMATCHVDTDVQVSHTHTPVVICTFHIYNSSNRYRQSVRAACCKGCCKGWLGTRDFERGATEHWIRADRHPHQKQTARTAHPSSRMVVSKKLTFYRNRHSTVLHGLELAHGHRRGVLKARHFRLQIRSGIDCGGVCGPRTWCCW